jgi:general secretion pathway protein I
MQSRERGFLFQGQEGKARQARRSSATLSAAGVRPDAVMEQKDRSRQQGFTLLEVMIALAIVGTTLIAMLSLGNRTIASSDHLQKLTQATLLAQEKMTEIERSASGQDSLGLVTSNGTFSEPFADFSWKASFASTPVPQVQQVTVTVQWGILKQNEMVDLTSFIFQ